MLESRKWKKVHFYNMNNMYILDVAQIFGDKER